MEIITQSKETYLSDEMIRRFKKLFRTEEDYTNHMRNLYNTRKGLYTILEEREDLKHIIQPQFHTLNELIGLLLMDEGFQHPCFTPK